MICDRLSLMSMLGETRIVAALWRVPKWLWVVSVAALATWCIGIFHRDLWTPDEPREADIAWRMSLQADRTLPQLAEQPFLEKPPLSYWLSADAVRLFGDSPAALRAPNLVYAIVTTIAIGALAFAMSGMTAAGVAVIVASSAFTAYRVAIWLAPDAALLAGCALALLGLYRGYVATSSREKLLWYSLMHAGALAGFMSKSGPGWLVPGLTLCALVTWERRWRELLRWQLWLGFIVQIAVIALWISRVLQQPHGSDAVRILFWNNLFGRFADLHATGALDYAAGHKNWPGKYLLELPYDLFPWILLVAAAARRAWSSAQLPGATGTSWRFALAACVPFLLLISLAATARDIYSAPAILGFSLLVGLWAGDLRRCFNRYDAWALKGTSYLIGLFMFVMLTAVSIVTAAEAASLPVTTLVACAVMLITLGLAALILSARALQRVAFGETLGFAYLAFAASLSLGAYAVFPAIDRWQNLGLVAQSIRHDVNGHELAVLQPDETTIALLDHPLRIRAANLDGDRPSELVEQWLYAHPHGRILVDLPGHAPGELTALFGRWTRAKTLDDGLLEKLRSMHAVRVVSRYELPQGRRYVLIGATFDIESQCASLGDHCYES